MEFKDLPLSVQIIAANVFSQRLSEVELGPAMKKRH